MLNAIRPWETLNLYWTAVDDRVRGGSSQSKLTVSGLTEAIFFGTLDTKTLGGAGFASQATTPDSNWDLSEYDGIELSIGPGDDKVYTFILKDEGRKEKRDDGREQSTLSWEYDFKAPSTRSGESSAGGRLFVPWSDFKPTYRGREKKGAGPLKTGNIMRFSLMMRSFFETQEGEFRVVVKSIAAVKTRDEEDNDGEDSDTGLEKIRGMVNKKPEPVSKGWMSWISERCVVS